MTKDANKKQQFNIYLPPDLVRAVKHASVDAGQSLSKFVEDALQEHLKRVKQQLDLDDEGQDT